MVYGEDTGGVVAALLNPRLIAAIPPGWERRRVMGTEDRRMGMAKGAGRGGRFIDEGDEPVFRPAGAWGRDCRPDATALKRWAIVGRP